MKKPQLQNILVPVDFSDLSSVALKTAERFARRFDAVVHLANVQLYSYPGVSFAPLAPIPVLAASDLEERRAAAERELVKLAKVHGLTGTCHAEIGGSPFDVICWIARKIPADLIVTSTHGYKGAKHLFFGSTAERLVQHSACPVLVAREKDHSGGSLKTSLIRRILVPVDFSPCSIKGLRYALQIAPKFGSEIVVLHALDMGYAYTADGFAMYDLSALEEDARRAAARQMAMLVWKEKFGGIKFEAKVKMGRPANLICDFAAKEDIDLIITSTHGYTGFEHVLIGSVAEHVVRSAPCPVLVVPSHPEVRRQQPAGATRLAKPKKERTRPSPNGKRERFTPRITRRLCKRVLHPFPERRATNKFRESHREQ